MNVRCLKEILLIIIQEVIVVLLNQMYDFGIDFSKHVTIKYILKSLPGSYSNDVRDYRLKGGYDNL